MDTALAGKLLASRVYVEFFSIGPDDVVLHAGCGEGAQVLAYGLAMRNQPPLNPPLGKGGHGGVIVCADVQKERVASALKNAEAAGMKGVEGVTANLESLPFADATFDKIIAVDIIQHVQDPKKVLAEFRRALKPAGELLITFPALQHYLLTKISGWKRKRRNAPQPPLKLRGGEGELWSPDAFNHNLSLAQWLRIAEHAGLKLERSHATTLFPPLHRYGIPRFWFSNETIHRIDYFLGGLPLLKRLGQAIMCVYRKDE